VSGCQRAYGEEQGQETKEAATMAPKKEDGRTRRKAAPAGWILYCAHARRFSLNYCEHENASISRTAADDLKHLQLHADRGDGRAHGTRAPDPETSTPGRLTDGHLRCRSNFHHVDGRDLTGPPSCSAGPPGPVYEGTQILAAGA
jgi:hypothetical protein